MAGTSEQKLMKALSARPGQLHDAAKAWRKAASGLEEIAAALDTGKTQISQSWQGTDADAATAAFSSLATTVRANKSRMQQAAGALDLAGDALHQAKSDYDTLPPVPPVPQSPEPDDSGSVSIQDEVHYLKLSGARSTAMSKREAAAATSYKEAVGTLSDAQIKMAEAAPETHKRLTDDGLDDTVAGPGSDAGGSTGGGSSLPGGAGRPVGAYGTGTGGTHASAQLISSSAPHLQDQLGVGQLGAQVITTGTEGVSVDGVVSGSVPSVSEGLAGNGSGVLNGSTGGLSGGTAGGMAGLVGGGGLLGALRGTKSTGSAPSGVSGAVRGIGGTAPTSVSQGGVGGTTTGAAKGGVLGGTGRPAAAGGVTGASGSSGGARAGSGVPGGGRAATAGTPGAGAGSSGAGSSGAGRGGAGGGAGSRSGGRYPASDARGAGGTPAEGRGSRSSGMQSGGRAGQGDSTRDAKRKSMVFEDDDAWIDDDDLGPGVMK